MQGKLADSMSFKTLRYVCYLLLYLALGFSYILLYVREYYFCFIVAAFLGNAFLGISTLCSSVLSKIYGKQPEPFSLFRVMTSASVVMV